MTSTTSRAFVRRCAALVVGVATVVAMTGIAEAAEDVAVRRLAGATRYETAAAISRATFPSGTRYEAVVARGDIFPDALAGTYLAGAANGGGPLLLTQPTELPAATAAEIERLGIQYVTILGSADAISPGVEAEIRRLGPSVRRVAGATRYDTAAAISGQDPENPPNAIFLASGETFADALAVSPLTWTGDAAAYGALLLTPSASLHPATRRALEQAPTSRVLIVGGTSAVSANVEAQVRAICHADRGCPQVERIAGQNRYETAVKIADLQAVGRPPVAHVNLARADTFPDAVAGGFHAGTERAPILFAENPDRLASATREWLRDHASSISSIDVLGDESAVSRAVVEDARIAATTGG